MRRCNAAHRLTEGGPLLAADDNLIIPIEAFHHDPDHYPDPLRFDPDRFYNRSLDTFNKTYFPFGRGPRNCVGKIFSFFAYSFYVIGRNPEKIRNVGIIDSFSCPAYPSFVGLFSAAGEASEYFVFTINVGLNRFGFISFYTVFKGALNVPADRVEMPRACASNHWGSAPT